MVQLAHSIVGSSSIHPSPCFANTVVGPGFEPLQYLSIGVLNLPIAPRMSDEGEVELDAEVLVVVSEQGTCELSTIVGDDPVRDTEATGDTADKLERRVLGHLDDWNRLRPLGT